MPTLVIPGVAVTVVKEVLPQQLSPSGVLGIVGLVEKPSTTTLRASSWSRFVDQFGAASAYSMPEAKQALDNGVSELVVVSLAEGKGTRGSVDLPANDVETKGTKGFKVEARAPGPWSNSFKVKIDTRKDAFDLSIYAVDPSTTDAKPVEVLRNLTPTKLNSTDGLQSLILRLPSGTTADWPKAGTYSISGGADAAQTDYSSALDKLKEESDVDMVLAAVQDFSNTTSVNKVYADVMSHCNTMSGDCKGRIGFGQVPPNSTLADQKSFVTNLVSDRFVLVAPFGVVGAMAGMVGNLDYWQSPTFKSVSGLGVLSPIVTEDQKALLGVNIVPIVTQRGRGTIALRGLTTDGDQISVRRVADYAVRTMKLIGDLFIGLLNNADGRSALKQKLIEALMQMLKDGAIVPSTDGKDPAFKVDVYSSQDDFAKGIVRVNMAVRPVRAIDYIYATITVQV